MGCVGTRYERRNQDLDDYNQLEVAYMGGEGRPQDRNLCPVDKAFLNYNYDKCKAQGQSSAKETYEIFRINKLCEIEDSAEELARNRLKEIIAFLEGFKRHIEAEGRGTRDFKKMLIGQKYETREALQQLGVVIRNLQTYIEESPTAAQVLDLDNELGMKSETIKGDILAWKRLPFFLLKLSLENPFLFDYIKYETMRAEVDDKLANQYAYVIWENKMEAPNLRKIGCLGGMITECINQGSSRRGLKRNSTQGTHEENDWALSPEEVYMTGMLSRENLDSLVEMSGQKGDGKCVLFPGVSIVYLSEEDAYEKFQWEHRSRSKLHNICFRLQLDTKEGRPNYKSEQQNRNLHGTLQTCFNLEKLMESQEFRDQAMVSRFYGSIEDYFSEKDPDLGQKVHTFTVKQKHAKYELIMDWEYKEETGCEPQWT